MTRPRLLCACFSAMLALPASAASSRAQRLVPANFNAKTDAQGFTWDINSTGAVGRGTNHCFGNALLLTVNGNQFNASQKMMTADGSEYVLSSTIAGVEVTRRIKVDLKAGLVRYVEVFKNPGSTQVTLGVSFRTQLSNRCQMVISDKGAPNPAALGKKESGLVAVQNPGPRPSILFWLAGSRSKVKPVIANNQNCQLTFTYALSLGGGKTVSLLHGVAQRRISGVPDAKSLGAMFIPFRLRKWMRGVPREARRTLANTGRSGYGGGEPEPLTELESLGVTRADTDILALGDETQLCGTAACARLSVGTRYGAVTVPLEKVAALLGRGRKGARLYLRDGQVFCGRFEARGLRFTLNSGLVMDLTDRTAGLLAMRAMPGDGRPSAGVCAFVETFEGDRLAVTGSESLSLSAVTPWGALEIPLDELRWLRPVGEDHPGHRMRLKDGSSFFAFLDGPPLALKTFTFGAQRFDPREIRAVEAVRDKPRGEDLDEEEITQPHIVLAGENVLVSKVDLAALNLVAAGELVPLPPDQIRVMHNVSEGHEDGTAFSAEIWGGGSVTGRLREVVLPVRVGGHVLQVPVGDIVDVFVPSPTVPDALRDRIAEMIRGLGHPDWEKREQASRELAGLGFPAKPQLTEAVKLTTDAEVRRRAQALLDGMQ